MMIETLMMKEMKLIFRRQLLNSLFLAPCSIVQKRNLIITLCVSLRLLRALRLRSLAIKEMIEGVKTSASKEIFAPLPICGFA
jgi:hypothetical protein